MGSWALPCCLDKKLPAQAVGALARIVPAAIENGQPEPCPMRDEPDRGRESNARGGWSRSPAQYHQEVILALDIRGRRIGERFPDTSAPRGGGQTRIGRGVARGHAAPASGRSGPAVSGRGIRTRSPPPAHTAGFGEVDYEPVPPRSTSRQRQGPPAIRSSSSSRASCRTSSSSVARTTRSAGRSSRRVR